CEQLGGGQLARAIASDRGQEPRRPPVLDTFIAAGQRADDFLSSARQGDVGQASLFSEVQFGRGQFLFQELVRQRQSPAATARGEPTLHHVWDDDEAELQPL